MSRFLQPPLVWLIPLVLLTAIAVGVGLYLGEKYPPAQKVAGR